MNPALASNPTTALAFWPVRSSGFFVGTADRLFTQLSDKKAGSSGRSRPSGPKFQPCALPRVLRKCGTGCSFWRWPFNLHWSRTINRRALCGRSACSVRLEGEPKPMGALYLYHQTLRGVNPDVNRCRCPDPSGRAGWIAGVSRWSVPEWRRTGSMRDRGLCRRESGDGRWPDGSLPCRDDGP